MTGSSGRSAYEWTMRCRFAERNMARATLQWWEVARGWRLGRRIEIGLLRFD